MPLRHVRKPGELGAVAGRGHDEATALHDAGAGLAPQLEPLQAELLHQQRRRLRLAVGREHGAGEPAGRARRILRHGLAQRHRVAAARQCQCLP